MGITSIDKLKAFAKNGKIILTKVQKLGLLYFTDLNSPIKHSEMKKINTSINKKINSYVDAWQMVGSYRRLTPFSNDIDIIIGLSVNSLKEAQDKAKKIIKLLSPFLIETLKEQSLYHSKNNEAFTVLSSEYILKMKYSKFAHKVDIKFYPMKTYYSALLYFTGSKTFNIKMRSYAKRKGYLLNEYGLFKGSGVSISIKSEKDIFEKLGLKYVEPWNRI
jgi:DNA polymerase/3'-5' exonuclease PolX